MPTEYRYMFAGSLDTPSGREGAPRPRIGVRFEVGKGAKSGEVVLTPTQALDVAARLIAAASRAVVALP